MSGATAPGSSLLFLFPLPCGFQLAVPITGALLIPLVSKPTLPRQSAAAATAAAAPLSRSHCSHTACRAVEGRQEKHEIVTEGGRGAKRWLEQEREMEAEREELDDRDCRRSATRARARFFFFFYSEKAATIYNCVIKRGAGPARGLRETRRPHRARPRFQLQMCDFTSVDEATYSIKRQKKHDVSD